MPKIPIPQDLFLDGPAGQLEAIFEQPVDTPMRGCAVVCHPHPQHGGTMHNKVAHTLARSFVRAGLGSLRFNFRGTERSEGEYDAGVGEVDDALVAIEWLRQRYPQRPLWLGGFSFGAAVVIKAAIATAVDGLISVAPAVSRFSAGLESQPQCAWLVVQGDQDDLVNVDETIAWFNELEPGPELLIVPGAEHFFHGRLVDLREAARAFIIANSA
jgi:alpha/beta superfamily hydrolase